MQTSSSPVQENEPVGVARGLTDFSYCCYLSDLAVAKESQHQGIGGQLIQELRKSLGGEVAIILVAAPEAADYYPRVGFERIPSAWLLPRER